MKALVQLEQRILAELNEVQEIQNKLVNSRMVKNLDYSDPQAVFLKDQGFFGDHVQKSTSSAQTKGLQKTKFMKRLSTMQTDCSQLTESQISLISRDKNSFKPSMHILSGSETLSNQTEDTQLEVLEPRLPGKGGKNKAFVQRSPIGQKTAEKRRWSLLEYEDPDDRSLSKNARASKDVSRQKKNQGSLETSTSKSRNRGRRNDIPINILVADYNKENYGYLNHATPSKSARKLVQLRSNTPNNRSLMNSKKKENPESEFSFRPQLSAKSMRIAENLNQSAFERLTTVHEKIKLTTEEMELQHCTFAPDINQKSHEIDQYRNKYSRREDRLLEQAEQSKKKIEKLKVSDYIKKELEFRNLCPFVPTTLPKPPNAQSQPVLERIENWQKKKEAHLNKLSEEAKSKQECPSFRPQLEQFKPEIVHEIPEKIIADKFLVEGLSEFLRRQSKAKKLRERSKSAANRHLVLRDYIGY